MWVKPNKEYHPQNTYRLTVFACCLTFVVIVLGAYTRLTDAGLGCPDWPGCYGHWLVPEIPKNLSPGLVPAKAWTEMIHRYVAGSLGLVIFLIFVFSLFNRCAKKQKEQPVLLPFILLLLVTFQALLGMWTVTLKLYPVVVMAHLLGGLCTLSLLCWLSLRLRSHLKPMPILPKLNTTEAFHFKKVQFWALMGLFILIIQLFLGGWTSANYAALACLDFPFCQMLPYDFDFKDAFNLTKAGVTGSLGEPLNGPARMTIHMVHRFGALITTLVLCRLSCLMFSRQMPTLMFSPRISLFKALGLILILLLSLQLSLGIANVLWLLPLGIAVAHNAVGALLLLTVIKLNYFINNTVPINKS